VFGIRDYPGFIAAIIAFQILPGPGTLAILDATARHGVRSGLGAVMGTLTGDLIFMFAAAVGLATLLAAQPIILTSLQWAGIFYLCYLGQELFWQPRGISSPSASYPPGTWSCFLKGLAVCLTNPKAILFFFSFFPLFLAPDSHRLTLGLMTAHVVLISLSYQIGLVLVGHAVAVRLSRIPWLSRWVGRVVGLGFLAFGFRLALSNRK
jgi:threonine/homoserine/homoserine lactone efflux protein